MIMISTLEGKLGGLETEISKQKKEINNYQTQITNYTITINQNETNMKSSGDESKKYLLLIKSLEEKITGLQTQNANYSKEIIVFA